ncbi:MAG: hypothetical protein HC850_17010 [Rhodomicrobium sp.]|nr:hypothetical protein [Rhodomicrobium sp.]
MSETIYVIILIVFIALAAWAIAAVVEKKRKAKAILDANKSVVAFSLLSLSAASKIYSDNIEKLSEDGRYKVYDFVHDMSSEGDRKIQPVYDRIEFEQAFDILRDLETVIGPVRIVLHTFGGFSLASEMIATALREHANRNKVVVEAYVPYAAMSGGTMIALAAELIRMGKNAALGPIDTQYYGFSAKLFQKLLNEKSVDAVDDLSFLIANESVADWKFSTETALSLAHDSHKKNGAQFIEKLAVGDLPHALRILPHEAKTFRPECFGRLSGACV